MTIDTLKTPPIAMGTWAWGDSGESGDGYFGSAMTRAGLEAVVDQAHAAGFTLWDTAVVYGAGRSETVLGQVLKRFARTDYQLSTKFTPQAAGAGADPMADMLDQSLERLGVDYIDLYWIHNPADVARWTPRLIPLLESGKVRHVGVSNHNLAEIERADLILREAGFRVEAVQNHYSLLYRSSEDAGVLQYCRDRGVAFFAYMVLEQGALSGRYGPHHPLPEGSDRAKAYNDLLPQLQAVTQALAKVGQPHGATAADVATAWAIAKGATPIIGVTRPDYVAGLQKAAGLRLSTEDIAGLEAVADAARVDTRGWWEKDMRV
jgi:1-deoxyxylulose-5-phosphate synthase